MKQELVKIEKNAGDATNFPMSKANIYPYNYVKELRQKYWQKKVESGIAIQVVYYLGCSGFDIKVYRK